MDGGARYPAPGEQRPTPWTNRQDKKRTQQLAKEKATAANIENVTFQTYDGYALPIEAESFDVVLLFNTLHVVKEPEALLTKSRCLLKPGGLVAGATDCYAEPVSFGTRVSLSAQKLLKTVGVLPFMHYLFKTDLDVLFEQNGFLVVDRDVLHPIPVNYYILTRKE